MDKQEEFEKIFAEHFFDSRRHKPLPDQVMARYTAVAYLEDGQLKRDLIALLMTDGKAESSARVFRVLGGASAHDSLRVLREIAGDLLSGMSDDEVAAKPYRFVLEQLFWATKGFVPENDPHWYVIPILNWGHQIDQLSAAGELDLETSIV